MKISSLLLTTALVVIQAGAGFAQSDLAASKPALVWYGDPLSGFRLEVPIPVQHQPGAILTPESGIEKPEDYAWAAHSNFHLFFPDSSSSNTNLVETPQTMRQVYNLPATGGAGVIAIIDVGHYPTALADFNTFAKYFGLPVETSTNATASSNEVFQVVYENGKPVATNASWAIEAALDTQWSHAMAPKAKIVLFEAQSASLTDLMECVALANGYPGVRQVSMSFGSSEFKGETSYDNYYFSHTGITYVASSGDTGGIVQWPAASANVVSVGGTTIVRNSSGVFTGETGWSDSGGGKSAYYARPSFQSAISSKVAGQRGVPDLAFDANPATGAYVYCGTPYEGYTGWYAVGGTSLAAPSVAGILNLAAATRGYVSANTAAELTLIYGNMQNAQDFRDITSGKAGANSCTTGWDFVTGVGTPVSIMGK